MKCITQHLSFFVLLLSFFCSTTISANALLQKDLQCLLDGQASSNVTRGSDDVIEIDISAYTEPFTSTLYVRNQNIRFVNGTLTQATSLNGPLIQIENGCTLEITNTVVFSGNKIKSNYSLVNVVDGDFNVIGGKITNIYGGENPNPNTNMNTSIYLNSNKSRTTISRSSAGKRGEIQGRIQNANGGHINLKGSIVGRISTSSGFSMSGDSRILANVYFYSDQATITLTSALQYNLFLNNYVKDQVVIMGYFAIPGGSYKPTIDDMEKITLGNNVNNYILVYDYDNVYGAIRVREADFSNITINDLEPGTLPERISDPNNVEELTITGKLNGTDIKLIRDMACKKLKKLDIGGCRIVYGGEPYLNKDDFTPSVETESAVKEVGSNGVTIVSFNENNIGDYMFAGLTSIKELIIPSTITAIGIGAFMDCPNLEKLVIGQLQQTTSGLLFAGSNKLRELQTNSNTYVAKNGVLYYNKSTLAAVLPSASKGTFVIAEGVDSIAPYSFAGHTDMTEISLPSSMKHISDYAFCLSGLTKVSLPTTVQSIGEGSFLYCTNLSKTDFPSELDSLGAGAFAYCDIRNVDLSMTLVKTLLGDEHSIPIAVPFVNYKYYLGIFEGNNNILTISLPSTIETIGGKVFTTSQLTDIYCQSLPATIRYHSTYGPLPGQIGGYSFVTSDTFVDVKYSFCRLHVPSSTIELYKTATGWKEFLNIIGDQSPAEDPNTIRSEEDLQKRLDEIAAGKPANPVTLTIQDKGITIKNTIVAENGCNAIITGGKITVSKDFSFRGSNCIFFNMGDLTFQNIIIDGNSIFFENAFFSNIGTLTIGDNVIYNNIYQGELRYGFYLSTGTLIVYSGDLTLNGTIFYPTHGGKVFIQDGVFKSLNNKKIVSGDDAVTIRGAKLDGGPINISNLTLADMEMSGIPELNVSSINTYHLNINRVLKLPLINLGVRGVITLNWHYRVLYSQMEYQGKWRIASEWAKMELERPFVVSGYDDYPMTQDDFNNMEFIGMPDDREAYFDETEKTVKLREKQKDDLPTTGCDEEWLQQKLDEIASKKPSEPVELTVCEDGIRLTKSILVDKDCKVVLTGGPITSETSIDYRYGREGLFMVYGELGFHDINLNFKNDAKGDGSLGYFWSGNGTLELNKKTVVFTTNGTVVGGFGKLNVTDAALFAGGEEMIFSPNINTTISDYVQFIGKKTYCNGKISIDGKTDGDNPVFYVNEVYVTSSLDLWAPKNVLQSVYLYKDASVNTYEGGFMEMHITGEWDQMMVGHAFVTSESISQDDYKKMTFMDMPPNLKAEFVPGNHQVRLISPRQIDMQANLSGLAYVSQTAPTTLYLNSDAVNTVYESATINHQNVTFNGMPEGATSRSRLHFTKDQILTISKNGRLTLTDIDITGEDGNEGFEVYGKLIISENVHVSNLPCLLRICTGGSVYASAALRNPIGIQFVNGLTSGNTVIAGTDGYQLTETDLDYITVEGCELQLDKIGNRIIALNGTGIEAIKDIPGTTLQEGIFDLSGRKVVPARQGMYIIKDGDKARKIYVK